MNTFMNEATLNRAIEAVAKFERMASKCDTVYSRKFDLLITMLERDMNDIYMDVRAAERVGYCTKDEYIGIYADLQNMRRVAIKKFRDAERERLGDREYIIRGDIYQFGYTREEAEKAYDEEWL